MSELRTQVHVSKDTGQMTELYIWDDGPFQWQARFHTVSGESWEAEVERKDAGDLDAAYVTDYFDLGEFPTLHAALEAYRASEYAVPDFLLNEPNAPYGYVIG